MSRNSPIHPAIPPEPKQGGGCVAAVAYAILFSAGVTILYAFFFEPFRNVIAARKWVATPCVIVTSELETVGEKKEGEKRDGIETSYRPAVSYRYRFDGKPHKSERIWFIRWGADSYSDAKAVVDRYPKGSQHTAYVNPENPQIAVLERGFRPQLLIALAPALLVIIGAVGLANRVYRRVGTPDPRFRPVRHHSGGASATHHAKSGLVGLIFVIVFAGIWNFVVSFLVREVISNWREGLPGCHGWFLTFFAIPFVLVGMFTVILPFFLLLKMFNPRPTLTLTPAEAPAGGSMELTWRFSGRVERIHRLRVTLEGREEATYGSGDDAKTAREIFMTIPVIDTTRHTEIRAGKARVNIPLHAVPTFVAPHNRIAWAIHFCGEIRRWPDVEEEFEFNVLPAAAAARSQEPAEAAAS
jgi:hypothetical protein